MATMSELIDQGVNKMRLPIWRTAYAIPNEIGPWAKIYDVLAGIGEGEPIDMLIGQCDLHTDWEPCE